MFRKRKLISDDVTPKKRIRRTTTTTVVDYDESTDSDIENKCNDKNNNLNEVDNIYVKLQNEITQNRAAIEQNKKK